MDPAKAEALGRLPAFGETAHSVCKICGSKADAFDAADLYRMCRSGPRPQPHALGFSGIAVSYFRCSNCDFLFTNYFDDWTAEDFSKYIYNDDYIKADPEYVEVRPRQFADAFAPLLQDRTSTRIIDYGSGTGGFAKAMQGYHFDQVACFDPFSYPSRPSSEFDCVCCFEVLEHTVDPVATLRDMLSLVHDRGLIFRTQCLQPDDIEIQRCAWWYIGPRNGHISTFSLRTLFYLANFFGLRLHQLPPFYLFAKSEEGPLFEALRGKLSIAPRALRLSAGEDPACWHEREYGPSGGFAWSSAQRLVWRDQLLHRGRNVIEIPFLFQVREGFASGCEVSVDSRALPSRVQGMKIVAEVDLPADAIFEISLTQPQLRAPCEFGRPDARLLGLALPLLG